MNRDTKLVTGKRCSSLRLVVAIFVLVPLAPLDFQEPYLRALFNFIGITDIQFVNANGLNSELREQSLRARERLQAFAINW